MRYINLRLTYLHHNGEGSGTVVIQTLPSLVLKLVWQGKSELMLCTNFSVASFNGFRNK